MMVPAGPNRSRAHSALVRVVTEYLQMRGAWVFKVLGGLGQRAGVPDILFALRGPGMEHAVMGAVECKTGKGQLTRVQLAERGRILSAGALYIEARSVDAVEVALLEAGLVETAVLWPRREG